jgi:hypothetical protein
VLVVVPEGRPDRDVEAHSAARLGAREWAHPWAVCRGSKLPPRAERPPTEEAVVIVLTPDREDVRSKNELLTAFEARWGHGSAEFILMPDDR